MRAALELLREVDAPGERVVVCGDMKELAADEHKVHRQLGEEVVTRCGADRLIACGDYAADVVFAAQRSGDAQCAGNRLSRRGRNHSAGQVRSRGRERQC